MAELTSRERVMLALSHKEPDRVPVDLGDGRQTSIYLEPYLKTGERLGLGPLTYSLSPRGVVEQLDERFLEALGIDFRRVSLRDVPEDAQAGPGGLRTDVWGIGWQKADAFWSPVVHPLKNATIDDLGRYPWPDPLDERRFAGLREEAEFLSGHTSRALVAKEPSHIYGILAQSIYLRGMENFFIDLMLNKEFANELMERVLQHHLKLYGRFLDEVGDFIQVVHTSDDLGTQTAPYFSPKLYREMIKPKQQRLMALIKNRSQARILYHSDGAISPLIGDLIEIGVDILNPIEAAVKGMDPLVLKETFGDSLAFHGGISQQQVLSGGTAERVREEVRLRVGQLAPGGGYICAAAQVIVPEVPAENVIALFDAARRYGRYPLQSAAGR